LRDFLVDSLRGRFKNSLMLTDTPWPYLGVNDESHTRIIVKRYVPRR
jgi:hypothetical protein